MVRLSPISLFLSINPLSNPGAKGLQALIMKTNANEKKTDKNEVIFFMVQQIFVLVASNKGIGCYFGCLAKC